MPLTGIAVRLQCRSGAFDGPTAGLAPGYVQGNLAILPRDWAEEFLRFCQANPKPCPLLGVSDRRQLMSCPRSAPTSTSERICRATASGRTARSPTSRAIFFRSGATIS